MTSLRGSHHCWSKGNEEEWRCVRSDLTGGQTGGQTDGCPFIAVCSSVARLITRLL